MLSPAQTIQRLGGIARGSHLQRLGFTRTQLSRLVHARKIQRVRAGIFATHELDDDLRTAAAHGGALTCSSALRAHEVWVLPEDDGLHVWLGPKGRTHRHEACSCTSHFYAGVPPLGYAPVDVALLHLRRCAGDEAFFAAFESAWRKRLLSKSTRARVRAALPSSARKDNHDSATKRHDDRVRDAAASALGYETLRFDYAQILYDWHTVQAAILGALHRLRAR